MPRGLRDNPRNDAWEERPNGDSFSFLNTFTNKVLKETLPAKKNYFSTVYILCLARSLSLPLRVFFCRGECFSAFKIIRKNKRWLDFLYFSYFLSSLFSQSSMQFHMNQACVLFRFFKVIIFCNDPLILVRHISIC